MNIFKMIFSYIYQLCIPIFYTRKAKIPGAGFMWEHKRDTSRYLFQVTDNTFASSLYASLQQIEHVNIDNERIAFKIEELGVIFGKKIAWFSFCYKEKIWLSMYADTADLPENFNEILTTLCFVVSMRENGIEVDTNTEWFNLNSIKIFEHFVATQDKKTKEHADSICMEFVNHYMSYKSAVKLLCDKLNTAGVDELPIQKLPVEFVVAESLRYLGENVELSKILDILCEWNGDSYCENAMIISPEVFTKKRKVLSETPEYKIYEGNIKLYTQPVAQQKFEFIRQLVMNAGAGDKGRMYQMPVTLVLDIGNKFLGYKFTSVESNMESIDNMEFYSQNQIFAYIDKLYKMCVLDTKFLPQEACANLPNAHIESDVIRYHNQTNGLSFAFPDIDSLFRVMSTSAETLTEQIAMLCLSFMYGYLNNTKGHNIEGMTSDEIWALDEVKLLSPGLSASLIAWLKNSSKWSLAETRLGLVDFLTNRKPSKNFSVSYDARLGADPTELKFTSVKKYEKIISEAGARADKICLPDGRHLIIFGRRNRIERFWNWHRKQQNQIKETMPRLYASLYVSMPSFDEILITTSRSTDGERHFMVCGYVERANDGVALTAENMRTFTNNDFLHIAARIFTCFEEYSIPLECFFMKSDHSFILHYDHSSFKIEKSEYKKYGNWTGYIHSQFTKLIADGCNVNALASISISEPYSAQRIERHLTEVARRNVKYCQRHGVYYADECPICQIPVVRIPRDYTVKFKEVYSDAFGKHYEIGRDKFVKIYPPEFRELGLAALYRQFFNGYWESSHGKQIKLFGQKCFIPEKLVVILGDANAVGYFYRAADVKPGNEYCDVNVDLKDPTLNNQVVYLALKRFLLQIQNRPGMIPYLAENPFTNIYLNQAHEEQVQILNVDFLAPWNICLTKDCSSRSWAMEYVRNVMISTDIDGVLQSQRNKKGNKFPKEAETLVKFLVERKEITFEAFLNTFLEIEKYFTGYCHLHDRSYDATHGHCKCCAEDSRVAIIGKDKITKQSNLVGSGGEAAVFEIDSSVLAKALSEKRADVVNNQTKLAAKVFEVPTDTSTGEVNEESWENIRTMKMMILERLFAKAPTLKKHCQNRKFKFILPEIVLSTDEEGNYGYLMPMVSNALPISSLKSRTQLAKLGFTKKDVLDILITMSEAIEVLHEENICFGDMNGENILYDQQKNVYFVDFDGMGVEDIWARVATERYVDPLAAARGYISKNDDWFSFAIHVFYTLTHVHPYRGTYIEPSTGEKMDTGDRMIKRISVVGKHAIQLPNGTEKWDWMTDELQNIFLNIFEGNMRESFTEALRKQRDLL